MLVDKSLLMADEQSSTVSAASTSYIDTLQNSGNKYINFGDADKMPWFFVEITTAVTGGTSVAFSLQTDTSSGFATALATLWSSGAIAVASLTAGYRLAVRIPKGVKRYLRGYATIVGPITTGAWSMGIAMDVPIMIQK